MALGKTIETRLRERELAGDIRAGSWARARARTRQRAFLRERWQIIAGFAALSLALGIVVCALTPSHFLKGLILGLVLAAVPGLLWSSTLQSTGTAATMMGDRAEQWTAQQLRKMRRHGWRVVNHFLLKRDDIDHVLIGPGGVWAVETKWSADRESHFALARERDAVGQASSNARSMSLWSELRKSGVKVQPAVVLWGGGVREWDVGSRARTIDDVPVLIGPALRDWVRKLPTDVLDPSAVEEVWAIIEAQANARDDRDHAENLVPPSATDYLARLSVALLSAMAAFVTVGQILQWTGSTKWAVCSAAIAVVPAIGLLRVRRLRFVAWGWIAGAGGPALALAVAEALNALT